MRLSFSEFIEFLIARQLSFACWRLPNTTHIRLLISLHGTEEENIEVHTGKKGYRIQAFAGKCLLIPADILMEVQPEISIELPTALQNLQVPNATLKNVLADSHTAEKYQHLVQYAVASIQTEGLKKVVVSRRKKISTIPYKGAFFMKIAATYPAAYISMHYTPEFGCWMGASPEILLSVQNGKLHTVALAGTQRISETISIKNAVWHQKEIEEQALVSRYIINCFKKIRLREFEEEGPRTIQAGNLLHLRTDYEVNFEEVNIPELTDTLLQLLHPTSAVGGMPREEALQFILNNEGYDRELYAGYTGPQNIDEIGECHFYVNIRCMQLFADGINLYAGGGITADSEPEKEWQETENKMEVLAALL